MPDEPELIDADTVEMPHTKATQPVQRFTVTDWVMQDEVAVYTCPGCRRRRTGPRDKPHMDVCGVWITIEQ